MVEATVAEVWEAWTTEKGVESLFAPACNVDMRPGGEYEVFFDPAAPAGQRGGEGNRVPAVQPMVLLPFTWNAPPSLPQVLEQRTHVAIRILPDGPTRTRVLLRHDGWGSGGQWDGAYHYFERAWNGIVLPRLKRRFADGPIDWDQ
jgi:uncharacterized protein YndB with AHSA1/START domain